MRWIRLVLALGIAASFTAEADDPRDPSRIADAELTRYASPLEADTEVRRGKLFEKYSASPVELGRLAVTEAFFSELSQALTARGSGLLPGTARSPEFEAAEARKLTQMLGRYETGIAQSKKGPDISLADVGAIALAAAGGNGVGTGVKVTTLIEKMALHQAFSKYGAEDDALHQRVLRGEASPVRAAVKHVDETIRDNQSFKNIFDRTEGERLKVRFNATAKQNLLSDVAAIDRKISALEKQEDAQARDAIRALRVESGLAKKRLAALENGQRLGFAELKQSNDELRAAISTSFEHARKELVAELDRREEKQRTAEIRRLEVASYFSVANTLATGMGFLGPDARKAGVALSTLSNTSLSLLQNVQNAALLGKTSAAGILMLGTGGIGALFSVISLMSSLFGEEDPQLLSLVLEEVRKLREDIRALHVDMLRHFDFVHEHLNVVYRSLLGELDKIEKTQVVHTEMLSGVLMSVRGLGDQVELAGTAQRAYVGTLAKRLKLDPYLPKLIRPGRRMDPIQYADGLQTFEQCATKWASDPLGVGNAFPGFASSEETWAALARLARTSAASSEQGPGSDLKSIFTASRNVAGLDATALGLVGNPHLWASCADVYVLGATERRADYLKYLEGDPSPDEIVDMMRAGSKIQESFHRISADTIARLLATYKTSLDEIKKAFDSENGRLKWLKALLPGLGKAAGVASDNFEGIDPWKSADKGQSPRNLEAFVLPASMGACPEQRFNYINQKDAPNLKLVVKKTGDGIRDLFLNEYQPYAIAKTLKRGEIELCYFDVKWGKSQTKQYTDWTVRSSMLNFSVRATFVQGDQREVIFVRAFEGGPLTESHIYVIQSGEWKLTHDNGISHWKPLFAFAKEPIGRLTGSTLADQLSIQWNDLVGDAFTKRTKGVEESSKEARARLLGELDVVFAGARRVIQKRLEKEAIAGTPANDDEVTLAQASDKIEGSRYLLEGLLTYRLPIAMRSAIVSSFHGRFALPSRALGFAAATDEALYSPKSAEDVELLKTFLTDAASALNEKGLDRVGIEPDEIPGLRKAIEAESVTRKQLAILAVAVLHREALARRLDLVGYREPHPVLSETQYRLAILKRNFDADVKASRAGR